MSLDLLHVLSNRSLYERYSRFVKPEALPADVRVLVQDLGKFFSDHPSVQDIDWEQFSEWFKIVQHSTYKEDKFLMYDKLFNRLATESPTDVAETIVSRYILQDYAARIADIALAGAEGNPFDVDDITALVEMYNEEVDRVSKLESYVVSDSLDDILKTVVEGGYNWRMPFLNKSIGNVRPGKLICFAARPNVGKTTFLASETTYLASQLAPDECILWFNNEEAGSDVKLRIYQAALQMTVEDIRADPKKALANYKTAINGDTGKIIVIDKADINVKDVEEFCRNHKVKVIVFDQLWKVHGFEKTSATDTARLGHVFQWAREIAKKYAPVITVHQLKTEADGVEYPTPAMLYLSGTVIQGEVDSLILMGRNYAPGQERNRFISIGKNKGAYGPEVDLSLAEGKHAIRIVPETAEFIE